MCNTTGREYFAYGGDFGEEKHDAQFCINGLFFPDGVAHPAVHECRYLQQPIKIAPLNNIKRIKISAEDNTPVQVELSVKLRNGCLLYTIDWEWSIISDRTTPLAQGTFEVHEGKDKTIVRIDDLLNDDPSFDLARTQWLNLLGRINRDTKWCKKGHVIVTEQYPLDVVGSKEIPNVMKPVSTHCVIVTEGNSSQLSLSTTQHQIAFDKESGLLTELSSPTGKNMFMKPFTPSFTRAETDNDRGGVEVVRSFFDWPIIIDFAFHKGQIEKSLRLNDGLVDLNRSFSSYWNSIGLSASNPPKINCTHFEARKHGDKSLVVGSKSLVLSASGKSLMSVNTQYEIRPRAQIKMSFCIKPSELLHNIPSLPRIGSCFVLHPSLCRISYFGRGPWENYPDRKSSAQIGLWNTTPLEMHVDYIVPSENGNRTDCRWVCFLDEDGSGLMLISNEDLFCISASLWSREELDKAKHTTDLESRLNGKHGLHVNIDHALMGVGGDVGWNPCVYEQYRVKSNKQYTFGISLIPILPGQEPAMVARRNALKFWKTT